MAERFVIETKGLKKTFISKVKGEKKTVEAVKGVDLAVKEGEIFGFLGPNGAGKSTTQRMLATLLIPTGGEAKITGYDLAREPQEIRCNIGYVSQVGGTDTYVTGAENLTLQARLYGLSAATAKERTKEFTQRFKMTSFIDRVVSSYSGGQKRRLDVALGMIHHPKLLLLDEPTTGLDPQSRAYMWEEIRKLKSEGVTIFMSTHYMDEADKLCDDIAIIDDGTIIRKGTPTELKNSIGADIITLAFSSGTVAKNAEALIRKKVIPKETRISENNVCLYIKDGEIMMPGILRQLDAENLQAQSATLSKPSLDDVFLKYTGRSLREDAE